jgi:hypothetical protein
MRPSDQIKGWVDLRGSDALSSLIEAIVSYPVRCSVYSAGDVSLLYKGAVCFSLSVVM